MALTLQPVMVATGEDGEGCLVFSDGWLVAVLVRLSDGHDEQSGRWFLEKGFGALDGPEPPNFDNLEDAQAWVAEHLANSSSFTGGIR